MQYLDSPTAFSMLHCQLRIKIYSELPKCWKEGYSCISAGRVLRVGKKKKDSYKMPKKTYWHLYSLQTLNTEKFVSVVNKILKHEFFVIK